MSLIALPAFASTLRILTRRVCAAARVIGGCWFVGMLGLLVSGCVTPQAAPAPAGPGTTTHPVFLVRRGWHIDIAFATSDLAPELAGVGALFPQARFVLFGFGDRRYLLHGANALAALWPGDGVMLTTGIRSQHLSDAFTRENVIAFSLDEARMNALQGFVRASLSPPRGELAPLAPGPYAGSEYVASTLRYSAARTCNTWAAQALQAAGVAVSSRGVVFAWQLWHEARAAAARAGPKTGADVARESVEVRD